MQAVIAGRIKERRLKMVQKIIPSTNIKLEDIRDTLAANGGNVTNVLGTFFAEGAKINKWSFYKPYSYAKNFDMTDAEIYNINCGMTFNSTPTPSSTITSLNNGTVWSYKLPTGGSSSPYRLGDFRGYNPKSTEWFFVTVKGSANKVIASTLQNIRDVAAKMPNFSSQIPGSGGLSGEYYLTLILYNNSNTLYYIGLADMVNVTSDTNAYGGGTLLPNIPSGTYKAALGISSFATLNSVGTITSSQSAWTSQWDFKCLSDTWGTFNCTSAADIYNGYINNTTLTASHNYTVYSEGGGQYSFSGDITVTINNRNSKRLTYKIIASIKSGNSVVSTTLTLSVNANSSGTKTFEGPQIISKLTTARLTVSVTFEEATTSKDWTATIRKS